MKILFLGRGDNHPATRYRITQFLDYLKANGVRTELKTFPKGTLAWWALTKEDYDVVFIQKKRVPNFWLSRFKKRGAKIIYDFDDAVMFASSRHLSPDSPQRMREFVRMVMASDGIIAGNSYLKSQAEPYNKKVWIIPTSIDTAKYPSLEHRAESIEPVSLITLGWLGGGKSLVFLKELEPVLEELSANYKIQLKIVCNTFFTSDKIKIIPKVWKEEEEVSDILTFDIGLSPLPDDPWSRGKCATKLLQYLAAGIPSVASAVGVHPEIIQDGVNGFLAGNHKEWYNKLKLLITDADLRKSLGGAARQTVEERYSVAVNAPKLLKILNEICRK